MKKSLQTFIKGRSVLQDNLLKYKQITESTSKRRRFQELHLLHGLLKRDQRNERTVDGDE